MSGQRRDVYIKAFLRGLKRYFISELTSQEPALEAHMSFPHTFIASHPRLRAATRQMIVTLLAEAESEVSEEMLGQLEALVLMMVCRAYDVPRDAKA